MAYRTPEPGPMDWLYYGFCCRANRARSYSYNSMVERDAGGAGHPVMRLHSRRTAITPMQQHQVMFTPQEHEDAGTWRFHEESSAPPGPPPPGARVGVIGATILAVIVVGAGAVLYAGGVRPGNIGVGFTFTDDGLRPRADRRVAIPAQPVLATAGGGRELVPPARSSGVQALEVQVGSLTSLTPQPVSSPPPQLLSSLPPPPPPPSTAPSFTGRLQDTIHEPAAGASNQVGDEATVPGHVTGHEIATAVFSTSTTSATASTHSVTSSTSTSSTEETTRATTSIAPSPPTTTASRTSVSTRSSASASRGATSQQVCPACGPTVIPDVVIPFFEGDLCKLVYTVKSLSMHDPDRMLGAVFLLWVSTVPSSKYKEAITAIHDSLKVMHTTHVLDLSEQVNENNASGFQLQQVLKLKSASLVTSEYYIVLDAKNTMIRDIPPDLFFNWCNRGKIPGRYHFTNISEPYQSWYREAAELLNVSAPNTGFWPPSLTPVVLHRQTVLDLLDYIGERPGIDPVCNGRFCSMLGIDRKASSDRSLAKRQGTSELALYNMYARSLDRFECIYEVVPPDQADSAHRFALNLEGNITGHDNIEICKAVASGAQKPYMFGTPSSVLRTLSTEQQQQIRPHIVKVFEDARLYDKKVTSAQDLVTCIVGKEAGPKEGDQKESHDAASKGDYCCMSARDHGDICGTCWSSAVAKATDYCGMSKANCEKCKKTWCTREHDHDWRGAVID